MSTFDLKLNIAGNPTVGVPSQEALDEGAPSTVELAITAGLPLPIPGPGGQPVVIGLGTITYELPRDQAIDLFKTGLEAAEALPADKPRVETAKSMNDVEAAAERLAKIKSGNL